MGLTVTRVSLRDFRSYERFELEPDPCLTVLVGPNAVGKTNVIEAIELLTEADSFRRPAWQDTVRIGSASASLALEAEGDGRHLKTELEIAAPGRRTYRVNGKVRRSIAQVAGIIPCVIFTPDDLRLVKDAAEKRRSALDALGGQLSPTYAQLKTEYDRVVRQRNAVLRDAESDYSELDCWTEQLVAVGGSLVTHRMRLFERLRGAMSAIYSELSDEGRLEAHYVPSWTRDGIDGADADPQSAMRKHLSAKVSAERARRSSISGPHRDEITFEIDGREARAFGSQGQQRTIALAWKLAEVSVITDIATQRPVLLLDDVMSELDEWRRHALAAFVGSVAQTVVTTTNLGYFEPELLARAKVVTLG